MSGGEESPAACEEKKTFFFQQPAGVSLAGLNSNDGPVVWGQ